MHAVSAFHPFERRVPIAVRPGMSLAAVAHAAIAARAEVEGCSPSAYEWFFEAGEIRVNGRRYERAIWAMVKPKPDTIIELLPALQGGKIGRIALILGTVALAVATAFIAPYASGALLSAGLSATAAQAGGAAIAAGLGFAGQLALKALTPSPTLSSPETSSVELSQAGMAGNQALIDQPVPGIIGQIHASPPPIIPAWSTLERGTVWIHAMVGYAGRNQIEDVRLNGVAIEAYPLAEVETWEGDGAASDSFLSASTYIQTMAGSPLSAWKLRDEDANNTYLADQDVPGNSTPQWHRYRKHADADSFWLRLVFDSGITDELGNPHAVPLRLRVRKLGDVAWRYLPQIHIKDIKVGSSFRQELKIKWMEPEGGPWVCRNDALNCHVALKKSVATGFTDYTADSYFTQTAVPTDALPAMTSATTSGVTVSASSTLGAGNEPWKAADNNTATYWSPSNNSLPATWQVDWGAGNSKTLRSYAVRNSGWGTSAPGAWTLDGSNDASTWVTLHSHNAGGITGDKIMQVDAIAAYRYHRVIFTANLGAANEELRVAEIELSEADAVSLTVNDSGVHVTQFSEGARYVSLDTDGATIWLAPSDWDAGEYDIEVKRGLAYRADDLTLDSLAGGYATDLWTYAGTANSFWFFDYVTGGKGGVVFNYVNLAQHNIQSKCTVEMTTLVYPERPIRAAVEARMSRIAIRAPDVTIESLSATFTGYARAWEGTVWATVATPSRNPAAYYRDALLLNDKNAIPLPGEIISETALETFHDWCAAEGFTCDAIVHNRSIAEVLALLASCGRASPRQANVWGVVIDQDRSAAPIRGVLTPENSRDLGTRISYPDVPDALRVSYLDEADDWRQKEVLVLRDGVASGAENLIETESYEGLTSEAKAIARATYNLRQVVQRRVEYSREVALEGVTYERGDLLLLADEVLSRHAYYGLIRTVLTSAGNVTGFVLGSLQRLSASADQITAVDDITDITDIAAASVTFGASIRCTDGTVLTLAIDEVTDTDTITLTTPVADTGQFKPWREVAIGPLGEEALRVVVSRIEHAGGEVFRLTLVDEANGIFA